MGALDQAVSDAARALPEGQIEILARALESLEEPSPSARAIFIAAARGAISRGHAEAMAKAWGGNPNIPGASLALALRSAFLACSGQRANEITEVAWTGPATPTIPVRRTSTILLDLISSSQRQLLVVSFAAYDVPEVLKALMDAASRGVDIILILESAEESRGALKFDAKNAFGDLAGTARLYSWPKDQRGPPEGPYGALHVKAVVADGERALVTSANLTGHALDINMELGLFVEGGAIPKRLTAHFAELIARGILREVA